MLRWRGCGLAYLPEDAVQAHVDGGGSAGRVLEDWCPPFPGHHLYYPSRHQLCTSVLVLLVDALRYRR